MASKLGQRVRLVKCPKCLKILQEDEDVPVYQCGGCSAILQAKRRSTAPKTAPSAGEAEGVQDSDPPNTGPSAGEAERAQGTEHRNTAPSAGEAERTQASEHPNTATSAGEAERAQASEPTSAGETEGAQAIEPQNTALSAGETEKAQASEPPNTEPSAGETEGAQASEPPSAGETEGAQASEPPSERETNNVPSSSGQDMVLPSPTVCSSGQEDEKDQDGSIESTENQIDGLELSEREESNEIQLLERSVGDSDKNEGEDNSIRLKSDMKSVAGTNSRSLNADHVVDARASSSSSDAYRKLEAEISPDASPVEEEQDVFQPHRESTDDLPNKTSSAYDGSKSSSDEREDQNEQWNALQKIRSDKFEMHRYPQIFKEQGSTSSSTFSDKRPSGTTTYNQRHQNRSLQLEGPGGRLARQGRRHVSEQLRPDVPVYPREPYSRVSPSYPSHDVFDRYSRADSLQMPPYAGGMNYEGVDHMYHNNVRVRERGQGSRFSGEMTNDTRNQPGWYSSQMYSSYSSYTASPQRLMEPPEYYHPRWSHEIVSDAEDHQRTRHADLQARRRQPVAKRHIRPTAGGAPFVSCYRCSQNLQLPVDFLIFKRKYHLLRCGTCTTVLRFSLQSRTHLIPAVTHDINANRTSNSTSESPRTENPSSSAAQEEEDEEEPVGRGSPLHRLMGYSTVSQVFKASQRPPSV